MEELPVTSEVSIKRGYWLVFPLGDHVIRAWNGISGLERVYVDTAVVSEHRNLGWVSVHEFKIGEDEYEITFEVVRIIGGEIKCRLLKDGAPVRACLARSYSPKPRVWPMVFGALGILLVSAYFKLPIGVFMVLMILFVSVYVTISIWKSRGKSGWSFDEIAPA